MMPSQEQFDAMHDAASCDWWDIWFERQQAEAVSETEVAEDAETMRAAFVARFGV